MNTPVRTENTREISAVLVLLALGNILTLVPGSAFLRSIGSAILFCFLPGVLAVSWLLTPANRAEHRLPWMEVLLLGSAASYLVTTMITLLVSYLPTPVYYLPILVLTDIAVLGLLYLNARRGVRLERPSLPASSELVPFAVLTAIMLLTVFLRFGNLGYAEYVGDEAEVVYRARQIILGNEEELFLQRKGPVQIMMTAVFALGTNSFDEMALRFPFALASTLSVLAVYLLGKSVWNRHIGLIASAVLAIDGIALGFSRLVQYQGVVLLTLTMIVFSLYRAAAEVREATPSLSAQGRLSTRYLSLGLVLFGLALLTHYETALLALPMAMIIYPLWTKRAFPGSPFHRSHVREVLGSIAAVLGLLLAFYLPFGLHPHFGDTYDVYTYNRIGFGRGEPFNNIGRYVDSSIFYNSVYYVIATAVMWFAGTVRILRDALRGRSLVACSAAILVAVGVVLSMVSPDSVTVQGRSLAFLFFVPVLLLSIPAFSRGNEVERAILVWLYVNFVAYAFFIRVPGLHYYTMAPAAALVAGVGLDWIFEKIGLYFGQRQHDLSRWLGWSAVGLILAVMAGYLYIAFVRTEPAYAIDFPDHRSVLYWTPQDEIPDGGFFGFVRHSGWRALPVLYRLGELRGTYMSNKKQIKPEWTYMRDPVEAEQDPRYFFYDTLSARMTSKEKYPLEWVEENYELVGDIRVNGVERIHIFERPDGAAPEAIRNYDAEDYEAMFARIDWLAEYREAVEHGLNEPDLAQVGSYLEQQEPPPTLIIFVDPTLHDAVTYHYGGSAEMVTLSSPSGAESLPAVEQGLERTASIAVVAWHGFDRQATPEVTRWLNDHFRQTSEDSFGEITVATFQPQE